ncbi:MAG TPA: hypothetical protein VJP77_08475, partial [Planctomycetota bacterium]|nr:hypothetical protein [Planctomycetota bacterium]
MLRSLRFLPFAALLAAPPALAGIGDFTAQVVPAFRGQPGALYAGFDVFTAASFTANTPDLGSGCAAAELVQLEPSAILTASGNLYSFAAPLDCRLAVSAPERVLEVVVQVRGLGTPLADQAVTLTALDGLGAPLAVLAPDVVNALGVLGTEFELRWQAALAPVDSAAFEVAFHAQGPSMSLDLVLVDVLTAAPALAADVAAVSLSAGGTQSLALDAGTDRAGHVHLVLGSATGTAGILVDGVHLPLDVDAYTLATLAGANGPLFPGTLGVLDGCGKGSAAIAVPAGVDPALAGIDLHHAFLAFALDGGVPV